MGQLKTFAKANGLCTDCGKPLPKGQTWTEHHPQCPKEPYEFRKNVRERMEAASAAK